MDKDKVAQELLNAAQQLTAVDDFTGLDPQERKRVIDEYDKRADDLSRVAHEYDAWWHRHDSDIKALFKKMYPKTASQKIEDYKKKRDEVTQSIFELATIIGMPISDMPED